MECVHPDIRNCQPDQICPEGYECCSENVPKGGKPTLGICVRANQCDKTRGLPKQSCRDSKYRETFEDHLEHINVYSRENYGSDCEEWRKAFWVMFLIMCLIVVAVFYRKRIVQYINL